MERNNMYAYLLSLGWKYHGYFLRDLYYIGNMYVFVYDSNKIGYYDKETGAYVYCNFSNNELFELTSIANKMNELETNPSAHTISEHIEVMSNIMKFLEQIKSRTR